MALLLLPRPPLLSLQCPLTHPPTRYCTGLGTAPMTLPGRRSLSWVGGREGGHNPAPLCLTACTKRHFDALYCTVLPAEGAKGPYRLDLGDVLYAPNVLQDSQVRMLAASGLEGVVG